MTIRPHRTPLRAAALIAIASLLAAVPATAQPTNPVYFDDAATAPDALSRARELMNIGNTDEAVRVLQGLLDESAEKLVASELDADLYIPVRDRVRAILVRDEALASRYRELNGARARTLLGRGEIETVERDYLMTEAGVDAAIRLAQSRLESARFHAALLTLEQLESHPLLTGDRLERAATLARETIGYLELQGLALDDDDRDLAERWARTARLDGRDSKIGTPDPPFSLSPHDRIDEIDISGLLPRPLWSVDVGDTVEVTGVRGNDRPEGVPDTAALMYMIPAVDRESIYVNDGFTITSWNRFSLSERWQTTVQESNLRRIRAIRGRTFSDNNAVSVAGRWVVGVMGLSLVNNESERSIAALDSRTGEIKWEGTIETLGFDEIERGNIIGPPTIDQRAVILTVIKDASLRRLHSIYAVAVDLVTGEPMWARPLGSVGKLPYGNSVDNGDLPVVDRGVMFRSDRIGFTVAVETVTGRVRWARRFDYTQSLRRFSTQTTWGLNKPVVHGDSIYTLNPERSLVQVINKRTGEIEAQVPSVRLGKPEYILVVDGVLIGVSPLELAMVPIDLIGEESAYQSALAVPEPGIRGRAVASSTRLVVPTVNGVLHASPSRILSGDETGFSELILDRPGTIMPLDEELLVVDDEQVHTYLLWESARDVLAKRIAESPENAAHAVTYAELAYRAGKTGLVADATDTALSAIELDPFSGRNEIARSRLFSALLDMIDPPINTRVEKELTSAERSELLTRLELCASTPRERVAALMAEGSVAESLDDPARAVDAYQRVLQDDALARTMHFVSSRTVPADDEATRRLRALVELHSREIYRPYDAEAEASLALLVDERDPAEFEAVARRYPIALVAPRAWQRAAERYERQGRGRFATHALGRGLRVAQDVLPQGDPLALALAGSLAKNLIEAGRLDGALELLAAADTMGELGGLTDDGSALDGVALLASVRRAIDLRDLRPSVGAPGGEPTSLLGWSLLDIPESMRESVPSDRVPMISMDGSFAVFGRTPDEKFGMLWGGVSYTSEELVRFANDGVIFAKRDDQTVLDRSFVKRDIETGEIVWKTDPFYAQFDEIDLRTSGKPTRPGEPIPRFDTPTRPSQQSTKLIFATSGRTLAVVSMVGLVACFDLDSGELLWKDRVETNRVHAIALDGATLAISGISTEMDLREQAQAGIDVAPGDNLVELFDARSGARLARHAESSAVRWVTFSGRGTLIAGTERAVLAYNPTRRTPIWRKDQTQHLEHTARAWSFGDRVLVQSENGAIWQIDARTGDANPDALLAASEVTGRWTNHEISRIGDNLCLATSYGIRLYDRSGALVGTDARTGGEIIPPAYAADRIVLLSEDQFPIPEQGPLMGFELSVHDTSTAKLLADPVTVGLGAGHASPDAIAVIDDAIIITSGSLTYVIDAPSERAP